MKFCPKCKTIKLDNNFSKNLSNLSGLSSWCKKCTQNNTKKYNQNPVNILKRKKWFKKYYKQNKKKLKNQWKKYYKENKNYISKRNAPYNREYKLKTTHGITLNQYNIILEKQGGVCAICNQKEQARNKRISVDHNHETGKIRGLLCNNCNQGLGRFKENTNYLANAIQYLKG